MRGGAKAFKWKTAEAEMSENEKKSRKKRTRAVTVQKGKYGGVRAVHSLRLFMALHKPLKNS